MNATAALTTSLVTNLNAALLLGKTWSSPDPIGSTTPNTVASTTLTSTGLATLQSAMVTGLTASQFVATDASSNLISLPSPAGRTKTFWHDEATIITGNPFQMNANTVVFYNMQIYQNPPLINDSFSQTFNLVPGAYTLYSLGFSGTNRGIASWYVDAVLQGTDDWYQAAGVNATHTTAINVIGNGVHTLRCIAASKNGASTGFMIHLVKYWIK